MQCHYNVSQQNKTKLKRYSQAVQAFLSQVPTRFWELVEGNAVREEHLHLYIYGFNAVQACSIMLKMLILQSSSKLTKFVSVEKCLA